MLKESSVTARTAAKALAVWVAILALAIANGALREAVLIPNLGTMPGLILSGILLSCLILAITCLLLPWLGVNSSCQLLLIGFGWLTLTLIFEFSFGLFQGKPLITILEAYTFKDGNIWPVVLIVTAAAPWIAAKLRR